MIEELVDIFSGIVQILVVALFIGGGYLGTQIIPEEIVLGDETIETDAFLKFVIGGIATLILEAIFLGPMLVHLDSRNSMRKIEKDFVKLSNNVTSINNRVNVLSGKLEDIIELGRKKTGQS